MARQKLLKLVTLDVTNTLIKVNGSPGRQYGIVGRQHGVTADDNLLTDLFVKFYKHYLKKYPNFGAPAKMPSNEWWSLVVRDCFRSVDPSLSEDQLQAISNDMFVHYMKPDAWDLLPGAVEALKDLRSYSVKLGVISNWDHRLHRVLAVMGLEPFFHFVLPSYVVGVEKPDSAIFHLALQEAGCQPGEAIHFGDSLEKDVRGAKRAGMDSCLLLPGATGQEDQAHWTVGSLNEFVDGIRPYLGSRNRPL